MISYEGISKSRIRLHYDLSTLFYRLLWGVHIHHGLWNDNESPRLAQQQLIEHLLNESGMPRGATVIDVGCGMGGSSIHMARHHDCHVTGITLSGMQRRWAGTSATLKGVGGRTRFLREDAETAEFPDDSFDYLWSIECTEHLFDKQAFMQRAARWLRPGGGVALCIWLAGDEPHSDEDVKQVKAVCDAFLCPSLGTADDYANWLREAGLEVGSICDLTPRIMRTWEICRQRVERTGATKLARLFGRDAINFIDNFDLILNAYRSGAMKYASIVAKKP
ncbi:MAG: class I SAM-dependent methyltransferase [Planctomycetaceae bacterium]|nr:class I SAM-dependent methyltransferase [Planctomycetales bacterium]MCB9874276.1 class I SAM-dependent methyltransferase [Planctomycetaceae bacterium]HRX80727.1 class I SAM-dependent methyltransferase [Pirellulaceae bacterium]